MVDGVFSRVPSTRAPLSDEDRLAIIQNVDSVMDDGAAIFIIRATEASDNAVDFGLEVLSKMEPEVTYEVITRLLMDRVLAGVTTPQEITGQ